MPGDHIFVHIRMQIHWRIVAVVGVCPSLHHDDTMGQWILKMAGKEWNVQLCVYIIKAETLISASDVNLIAWLPLHGTSKQKEATRPMKPCTIITDSWLLIHALFCFFLFLCWAPSQARKIRYLFWSLWYDLVTLWTTDFPCSEQMLQPLRHWACQLTPYEAILYLQ